MVDREELQQAARIVASEHLIKAHGKLDSTTLQYIVEKPPNVWTCVNCGITIFQEAMFEVPETPDPELSFGAGQPPPKFPTEEELAADNEPGFASAQPMPGAPLPLLPNITELVKLDLERRAIDGEKKYGQRLKPFNGRDALIDAYQEAMDLTLYLRQELFESYNR